LPAAAKGRGVRPDVGGAERNNRFASKQHSVVPARFCRRRHSLLASRRLTLPEFAEIAKIATSFWDGKIG
jgi:hypothetical protein